MINYFSKNSSNDPVLFDAIDAACDGLIYISERDAPVLPFVGRIAPSITPKTILQEIGCEPDAEVKEVPFEPFFDRLTTKREWFGDTENATAERYAKLREVLAQGLIGLKVCKIGHIKLEILVVGLDKDSRLMGVRTKSVET